MRYQQKQRHFSRRVILMEKYFVDMEEEKMWKFFFLCFLWFSFWVFFFLRTPKRFRSPVISQTLSFRDSELDACVTNNDSSWNQLDILNFSRKLSTYLPHTKKWLILNWNILNVWYFFLSCMTKILNVR